MDLVLYVAEPSSVRSIGVHLGLSLARWPRIAEHRDRMAALEAFASTRPSTWGAREARDPWSV
jgi:hypothetical protein